MDESDVTKNYSIPSILGITIGIFIIGQLIGAVVLNVFLELTGSGPIHLNSSNVVHTFLFILFADASMIGLVLWFIKRKSITMNDIGLNKPALKYIGYALLGFGTYFAAYITFVLVSGWLFTSLNLNQEQDIGFSSATRGNGLALIFISLVLIPPITEEILMRGFLFGGLRKHLNFLLATMITSLFFALAHLPSGKDGLLWIGAIDTFILSLVLCYLRETTRSLWPPIGVHMIKNFVAFLVLFKILG